MIRRLVVLMAVFAVVVSATLASGRPPQTRTPRTFGADENVVPGVIVVKFMPWVEVDEERQRTTPGIDRQFREEGVLQFARALPFAPRITTQQSELGYVDLSRVYIAEVAHAVDPRLVASRLGVVDGIEYAEPKLMNYLNDTPNDPLLANQTSYFTRMNTYNGWTIAKGDSSVYIAVVDGGTYWPHEDLQPNYRFGWNFANNSNDPRGLPGTPNSGAHGTATASHFGARTNNSIGMAGTSWNCSMIAVNAASPTIDNAIAFGYEGIAFAFANGADVINCSWGRTGGYSQFEQDVINAATQAGALVVCAAGNGTNNNGVGKSNDLAPDFPPSYSNVLAVGATNSTSDVRASFSNYGRTVPVYAPGVSIFSAFNGGGYGNGGNGTSYSSPLVAGLAGIIKSYRPLWTPRQIALQIKTTCDSIDGVNPSLAGNLGRGRVNFERALSESHAGIDIVSADIRTPSGRTLFLQNDTIMLTLTVKNVLFAPANNLVFTATTSDASVTVLQGTVNAGTVAPDQQVTLPSVVFRVGALSVSRDVSLRLNWVSNGNERDSWAYKVTVFPAIPQWESQASPTQTSLFSVRAVSSMVAWAAGGNGSGSAPVVIVTTNGGSNWLPATGNLTGVDLYCVFGLDELRAWVGTGNGRIYKTTDAGTTWSQQTYPGTQSPFINGVWMFSDGTGYAQGDPATSPAGRFIVLKTTDYGQTWNHLANEPVGSSTEAGWNNSFWWTNASYGWFGTNNNKVWRTTDGGTTWASSATGVTNSYGVAFKDNNNGIAIHSTGAVRVSVNGGATWSSVTSPTTSPLIGVAYPAGSSFAWIAAGPTAYRSTNNGSNWNAQTMYPFTGSIYHLSMTDTSTGWAVTSNGEVLKYRPPGTTGVQPSVGVDVPGVLRLEQNYPNPFNPGTNISFTLQGSGFTSLKVFDLLGREVATLVNEVKPAGSHTVTFDASGLASGLYIYRLSVSHVGRRDLLQQDGEGHAGAFTATKKMVVLK